MDVSICSSEMSVTLACTWCCGGGEAGGILSAQYRAWQVGSLLGMSMLGVSCCCHCHHVLPTRVPTVLADSCPARTPG